MKHSAVCEASLQLPTSASGRYNEARRDLLDARDGLTAMLQSAQEKLDQTTQDIDAHQQEARHRGLGVGWREAGAGYASLYSGSKFVTMYVTGCSWLFAWC